MRCEEIIKILERQSPREYAMDWDHVGLLVGRRDKEVKKMMLVVDVTNEVVDTAVHNQIDMIVSHHPMIFGKIDRINDESVLGKKILALVEHGICCYAMHTNFDTKGGMAKEAARCLGLQNTEVLEETLNGEGIGQIGMLKKTMTLGELALYVKQQFGLSDVMLFGNSQDKIEKVAISPGSGKSMIDIAYMKGAQCLITGDIGHHEGIDAVEMGVSIIDASHYGLEKIFMTYMYNYLKDFCPEVELGVADVGRPYTVV